MTAKNIRNVPGYKIEDSPAIHNNVYNNASGAEKNTDVGKHFVPLNIDGSTYTTDATTARRLPSKGRNIAVYNKGATLRSVTLGDGVTVLASLAVGVVDNATKRVGIAIKPNDWTFIACYEQVEVISDHADCVVYLIEDDSFIKQEAAR